MIIDVRFEDTWLTLAADPTLSVHAACPERTSDDAIAGEVRYYAGGRARSITSDQQSATFPLTLQLLSAADAALLKSWRGQVMLLRDGEGRRVWGTFFSRAIVDYWDPDGTVFDVTVTFQELTYIETPT